MLAIGDRAPEFEGSTQTGERVSLSQLVQSGPVVVFFYPKDFTPVCTAEVCGFRDLATEFAERGVQVVGISGDDEKSHQLFAQENKVHYPLLSDPGRQIARAYKALWLGKFPKRVTYVVDEKRTIVAAAHSELNANKHLERVRAALDKG